MHPHRPVHPLLPLAGCLLALSPHIASAADTPDDAATETSTLNLATDVEDSLAPEPTESDPRESDLDESDALAFDRISISEIEEMGRQRFEAVGDPPEPIMRPEGVDDPFPDRHRRSRLHNVVVPLTVSVGLVGGGAAMAHLALNPNCDEVGEIASCSVPNGADLGVRGGRALAAVGFGLGGAVFGVLGGRELGYRLQQSTRRGVEQRRRVAVGVGTTSVALGVAGIAAGSVLLASGIQGARDIGDDVRDTETAEEALPYGDAALARVTQARAGFMLLVSTPALVAMGASLLAHRPRRPRISVSPTVSRTQAGLIVRGRF